MRLDAAILVLAACAYPEPYEPPVDGGVDVDAGGQCDPCRAACAVADNQTDVILCTHRCGLICEGEGR